MHFAPHQGPLGLPAGMLPASVASPLGSTFGPVQGPPTTPPGESLSASSSAKPCVSDTTETSAAVPHASHAGASQETSSLQVSSTAVQGHQLQALHSCLDTHALLCELFPAEVWNGICVSHNCASSAHQDLANQRSSPNLAVGLGAYSGGELWIQGPAPAGCEASTLIFPCRACLAFSGVMLMPRDTACFTSPGSFGARPCHSLGTAGSLRRTPFPTCPQPCCNTSTSVPLAPLPPAPIGPIAIITPPRLLRSAPLSSRGQLAILLHTATWRLQARPLLYLWGRLTGGVPNQEGGSPAIRFICSAKCPCLMMSPQHLP